MGIFDLTYTNFVNGNIEQTGFAIAVLLNNKVTDIYFLDSDETYNSFGKGQKQTSAAMMAEANLKTSSKSYAIKSDDLSIIKGIVCDKKLSQDGVVQFSRNEYNDFIKKLTR